VKHINKKPLVAIVDYGMGNLRSVSKAVERMGGQTYVGTHRVKIESADKIILPGVGDFGHAVRELKKRKLFDFLQVLAVKKKIMLGICLGLQLFFESSEESPGSRGLGLWKGSVKSFKPATDISKKIPHMGWNEVQIKRRDKLLRQVKNSSHFYFVHSFYAKPTNPNLVMGVAKHGVTFPAILGNGHLFALQFHPEKSQTTGLQILKNFIER
jgi:imidazole glycerol-phosphate synthase subunit HisH